MRELRMVAVALALTLAAPAVAQATTFTVTRNDDSPDASTADPACDAVDDGCTLRAAVQQANASAGADVITLPAGTITLDISGGGDAAAGALEVTESLTIVGTGIDTSIIEGHALADAVFLAGGGTDSLVLQDLSITGNASDVGDAIVDSAAPATTLRRAGIFDSYGATILGAWPEGDGTLTLDGARLTDNAARDEIIDAGPDGDGTLTVTGTTISGNEVSDDQGFPAIVDVNPWGDADVAIERSTFSGNSITGAAGSQGVVDVNPSSGGDVATTLRVTDSAFSDNTLGDHGVGALHIDADSGGDGPVDASILRTRFERNVAGADGPGEGGAIQFSPGDEMSSAMMALTITDSSFIENVAGADGDGRGGAIDWNPDGGNPAALTIDGSTFAGNRAGPVEGASNDRGGAIAFDGGTLIARNSTFSGNHAEHGDFFASGGAIAFTQLTSAELRHVTMVGNSVAEGPGGGISVPIEQGRAAGASRAQSNVPSAEITIANSIVAGNTSDDPEGPVITGVDAQAAGVAADCSDPVTSAGGNIEGDTTCGFSGTGDRQSTDPKVAALAANGGPTKTHAIGTDSPAFEAALGSACLPKDQRGVKRPQFAACDIGAFELGSPPAVVPAKPAPRGAVQGETARSCASRRSFRIRIRVPRGAKAVKAIVLVNGKRVAVRRGKRLTAPVRLRGLPAGKFRVRIVLRLADGRKLSGTRRYHTCHEAIAPKRIPRI